MFYGVINESYDYTEHLEMELENSLLFFKSLDIIQESGIQIVQEGALGTIVEKVKELWSKFKEWVKGIIEKIKNFFGKFKKKSESKTEEKIVQSLQNPQVAPKGSDKASEEKDEKTEEKTKNNSTTSSNNSKIFYIEDKGYDDNWKNTEYMDFSEGCKKIVQKREFHYFDKFPYYYAAKNSTEIGYQQAFNAEDTVKIDKDVEDFFTTSFGAFYNATDDEIVIKQKPKESDVQKFAKDLGDILIMTREYVKIGNKLPEAIQKDIDNYQVQLDKFMKNAPIVSSTEYKEAKKKHYNDRTSKVNPSETMLVRRKDSDSDIDTSVIAKFIVKDIDNMKKYISLITKVNTNCIKVYNYDINFAKAKMFSDQIRRLEDETAYAPDKLMAAY